MYVHIHHVHIRVKLVHGTQRHRHIQHTKKPIFITGQKERKKSADSMDVQLISPPLLKNTKNS